MLLAACGGGDSPAPPSKPDEPLTPSFQIAATSPTAGLKSGDRATIQVTVTPVNGFTGPVTAELVNAPAGVTAAPVSTTVTGTTTLTLSVQTGSAAGILTLPVQVKAGAVTQTDEAYAAVYRVSTLPSGSEGCDFPNCRFPAGEGAVGAGGLWLMGATNSSAKGTLVRTDLLNGQVTTYSNKVNDYYNDYSSSYYGLVVAGGVAWTGVTSSGVKARMIGVRAATGELIKAEVGEAGAVILELVALPDGRVGFLHQTQATAAGRGVWSIGVFDPATLQATLTPIADGGAFLTSLSVAPDGQLWTQQGYAAPSLVRFDPVTRAVKRFSVGTESNNLPLALTITRDGRVWYIDSRASQIGILNPADGAIRRFNGFTGMGRLHALGNDVLAAKDEAGMRDLLLLSDEGNTVSAFTFPTLRSTFKDLDGFAVGADGSLGYESGGEAYVLPAN